MSAPAAPPPPDPPPDLPALAALAPWARGAGAGLIGLTGLGALLPLVAPPAALGVAGLQLAAAAAARALAWALYTALFCAWLFHAVDAAQARLRAPQPRGPGATVAGLFVPGVNLVWPYRSMQALWRAGDAPGAGTPAGAELGLWWAASLLGPLAAAHHAGLVLCGWTLCGRAVDDAVHLWGAISAGGARQATLTAGLASAAAAGVELQLERWLVAEITRRLQARVAAG